MKLKPLGDRVLVRRRESEQKIGSIIVPSTAQERSTLGEVVAVGPGRVSDRTGERVPPDVSVGDVVLFGKFGGTDVEVGGEKFVLVSLDEVQGVLVQP